MQTDKTKSSYVFEFGIVIVLLACSDANPVGCALRIPGKQLKSTVRFCLNLV